MVIDRRSFIQGAALLSTSGLLFSSADGLAGASPILGPTAPPTVVETSSKCVLKIAGWDRRDQHPAQHTKMLGSNLKSADLDGDEVFVQVNRAWRTAWR
jgi:hypothetical protein